MDVGTEWLWGVLDFLQTYNGAITALATGAIGVFTFVLVIVTRRQAILTKKSINISERALIDLERPFIVVENIWSDMDIYLAPNSAWDENLHNPRITLSIVNYGRTPGNIEFAAMRVQVSAEIPKEMTRLHLITANPPADSVEIIIAAGKSFSFPEFRCDPRFTYADRTSIHAETHRLYCHGLFTYRDIFGNSHTTKFCRRYLRERNEWPPDGGSERNRSN